MKRLLPIFGIIPLVIVMVSCRAPEPVPGAETILPNIIYVLADDLGYGDISALNDQSSIQTPHLDRLVREGITFTDAHSASAVCTPTRYGILTGRYAWRTSLKSGVLWGYSPPLIPPEEVTVASFLQDQGYRTGVVGKWHLGLGWQPRDPDKPIEPYDWQYLYDSTKGSNVDFRKPVSGGPNQLGFDYSFIFPASLDMTPYLYLENDRTVSLPNEFTPGRSEEVDGRGVFWRAGEMSQGFDFFQVLNELTEKAISFVQVRKTDDRPFFLYFPLTAPHAPWLPTPEVEGSTEAGRYGDFVKLVDNRIGDLLRVLDSLGITEQTLVVFSSDNGAHWTENDKQQFDHRSNFIFRGQKADIYEGGHRIPYLARWPGIIPANRQSSHLISTTDFLATVAGLVQAALPRDAAPDSYNMWNAYLNPDLEEPIRNTMVQHSLTGLFAMREGKWKYTPRLGSGGFTQPVILEEENGNQAALYDLQADVGESTNLIAEHPQIAARLHELLEASGAIWED